MEKFKRLEQLLTEFFKILEIDEESDSGRVFNPVYISSCRVMLTVKLNEMFAEIKQIINYK